MAKHALSWVAGGAPRAIGLDLTTETLIGRDPSAAVVIELPTISRRQAVVRHDGRSFRVENLSATNPTLVDGKEIAEPANLRDGTVIAAGSVSLRFHDLSAGDRVGGPICSHCGRENGRGDADCWFCGTSLVNAASTVRTRVEVVARLVDLAGDHVDLYPGQALGLGAAGWAAVDAEPSPETVALVQVTGGIALRMGGATFEASASDSAGMTRSDGEVLQTGDLIRAADGRWAIVIR